MHVLNDSLWFPDPESADQEGLLAVGGDLSVARLSFAYHSGIFPWYNEDQPILWWSPDPRMVLFPEDFIIRKSFKKRIATHAYRISWDTAFEQVIEACSVIERPGQAGTWITAEMLESYIELHKQGLARSIEVWEDDRLAAGLYGIDLKTRKIFCGESMFSTVSDGSKLALHALVQYALQQNYRLIDCQVYTDHLYSLGALEIPRAQFLEILCLE